MVIDNSQGYRYPIAQHQPGVGRDNRIGRSDEQRCSAVRDGLADDEIQVEEPVAQNPVDDRHRKENRRQRPESEQGDDQGRVFGCAECERHPAASIERDPNDDDNEQESHPRPACGIGRDKACTHDQHADDSDPQLFTASRGPAPPARRASSPRTGSGT